VKRFEEDADKIVRGRDIQGHKDEKGSRNERAGERGKYTLSSNSRKRNYQKEIPAHILGEKMWG